ncbi:MAG: AIR synthase-related protein, partial [Candidatus Margulisiibacteriota bacterium]
EEENEIPQLDLDLEKRVQQACLEAIQIGIAKSAHDLSEGGLAVALCECATLSGKGAIINLSDKISDYHLLFGESQSRILITIAPENIFSLSDVAMLYQVPCSIIGKVAGRKLTIFKGKRKLLDLPVSKIAHVYQNSLAQLLEKK